MLPWALSKKKPAKTAYDNLCDLMDRDPLGWAIDTQVGFLWHRETKTRVWTKDGMPRILEEFRAPNPRERDAMFEAYDRMRSAWINKDLHDGP